MRYLILYGLFKIEKDIKLCFTFDYEVFVVYFDVLHTCVQKNKLHKILISLKN